MKMYVNKGCFIIWPIANLLFLSVFLVFIAASVQAADKALLIGVSKYEHKGVTPLPGVANDLVLMRDLLINRFDVPVSSIKELRDEQASREAILSGIDDWLIEGTSPGDRIFLYYSGHGSYTLDISGDESYPDGDGFDETLVPYDAYCKTASSCQNMVLDDEIDQRLRQLSDRFVFTMFDSCHSGTATRSFLSDDGKESSATAKLFSPELFVAAQSKSQTRSLVTPQAATRSTIEQHQKEGGFVNSQPAHVNLFAVQSFQEALEVSLPGLPRGGLFTRHVYDALNDKAADYNDDSRVSFAELQRYTEEQSAEFCKNDRVCQRKGVTPLIEVPPDWVGEAVVSIGKASAQAGGADVLDSADVSSILSNTNEANLQLSIEPDKVLRPKDEVRFKVTAERSGVLLLFDRDAHGVLRLIYPQEPLDGQGRRGQPVGWVNAGSQVVVPDSRSGISIVVDDVVGEGVLFAVLAENTQPLTFSTRAFQPVERQSQSIGQLRLSLDQLIDSIDADLVRATSDWSMTSLAYEVVEP